MNATIRRATPADVPALAALLSLLFTQETEFTPDLARQSRALHLILARPTLGCLLAATRQSTVVGMVSLLFTVSTAEGGPAAWLEDLIVHPGSRGGGIGGELLAAAVREARAAGCLRLTLLTSPGNESAIRFYRRAGFSPSPMVPLRLPLSPPAPV